VFSNRFLLLNKDIRGDQKADESIEMVERIMQDLGNGDLRDHLDSQYILDRVDEYQTKTEANRPEFNRNDGESKSIQPDPGHIEIGFLYVQTDFDILDLLYLVQT
jgi:hypothetical protein